MPDAPRILPFVSPLEAVKLHDAEVERLDIEMLLDQSAAEIESDLFAERIFDVVPDRFLR